MIGAAFVALSLAVPFAAAQRPADPLPGEQATGRGPGGSAGVERARAAGVRISPDAAAAMARAPAGTCMNEPTLAKCSGVKEVVAGGFQSVPESAFNPPEPLARSTPRARAAQSLSCFITARRPEMLNVSGNYRARGQGDSFCTSGVVVQELYVDLERYQGGWGNIANDAARANDGRQITAIARYDCYHFDAYNYRTQALGYAEDGSGRGFTGSRISETQYYTCPG